jgi:hypothetical protein
MDPALLRVVIVAGVIVVAVLVGRWWQRRDGAVRRSGDTALRRDHLDAVGLDLAGAQAGAVLLGSSTCTPCDSVKEVLGALEATPRLQVGLRRRGRTSRSHADPSGPAHSHGARPRADRPHRRTQQRCPTGR